MRAHFLLVVLESCFAITACGASSSSGTSGTPAVDAASADGAASDAPSNSGTLTLSGTAKEISSAGQTAIAGVMLTAYNAADDSVLGTAMSAADGTFSITVTSNGAGIDGYLKATTPGIGMNAYKDSYLYPPATLTASYTGVPVYVLKVTTYNLVNAVLLGNNQSAQNGWIALLIEDAVAAPVAGAVVTSTPGGQVNYNASNLPSSTAKSTANDGIAYDTNIAPGKVLVKATKTGATFTAHSINVRPERRDAHAGHPMIS